MCLPQAVGVTRLLDECWPCSGFTPEKKVQNMMKQKEFLKLGIKSNAYEFSLVKRSQTLVFSYLPDVLVTHFRTDPDILVCHGPGWDTKRGGHCQPGLSHSVLCPTWWAPLRSQAAETAPQNPHLPMACSFQLCRFSCGSWGLSLAHGRSNHRL